MRKNVSYHHPLLENAMKAVTTDLPGVLVFEPTVMGDERGFFFERFQCPGFPASNGAG